MSGCCSAAQSGSDHADTPAWITGSIETGSSRIPLIANVLNVSDYLGAIRVRMNLGRMEYLVPPGLYATGNPNPDSPVFISANYKLSFDYLRQELKNIDGWILVLDTRGVNVWCAAGKGTFGTSEIVRQVRESGLSEIVSHKTLIVPQLGAPGVSAHKVRKECGFKISYGPVKASDIPLFLKSGGSATPEMRRIRFPIIDRLVLIPVEIVTWSIPLIFTMAVMIILAGLHSGGYSTAAAAENGIPAILLLLLAVITGGAITPLLLPWIPGRAFALKGALAGLVIMGPIIALNIFSGSILDRTAWIMIGPAISSFVAMNFTGASTFTSQSGVLMEMRTAVPLQIAFMILGVTLWITARLTGI